MANPQLIKKDSKGIYPHPNEMAHPRLIKKDSKGIYPIYLKANWISGNLLCSHHCDPALFMFGFLKLPKTSHTLLLNVSH